MVVIRHRDALDKDMKSMAKTREDKRKTKGKGMAKTREDKRKTKGKGMAKTRQDKGRNCYQAKAEIEVYGTLPRDKYRVEDSQNLPETTMVRHRQKT